MPFKSSPHARNDLIVQLDLIIENHGATDPELHRKLCGLRAELERAIEQRNKIDAKTAALRIAYFIKFLWDSWPD